MIKSLLTLSKKTPHIHKFIIESPGITPKWLMGGKDFVWFIILGPTVSFDSLLFWRIDQLLQIVC